MRDEFKAMKRASQTFHVYSAVDKHGGDHYSYSHKLFDNYKKVLRFMTKQGNKGIKCVGFVLNIDVFGKIKMEYIGVNYEN